MGEQEGDARTAELFTLLSEAVEQKLQPERRVELPGLCDRVRLPRAPNDPALSKKQYIHSRVEQLAGNHEQIRQAAEAFAREYPIESGCDATFEIEEALWRGARYPEITKRLRREIAEALDGGEAELWLEAQAFEATLSRLWVLGGFAGFAEWDGLSLRSQINRHVIQNPGDWPVEHLFGQLGALDCSSRRFGLFLEALAGPEVRPDEECQRAFVECVGGVLRPHRLELAETGTRDGYPTFSLRAIGSFAPGRPKNLIFASTSKPDLRFSDAVVNDIEIVTNKDKVLVFDRPIPQEGLWWRDLQAWWADREGLTDAARARSTLYHRLRGALPESSPPQLLLFDAFYESFGAEARDLPALIPEVWLHYDPQTVTMRGRDALLRQRMDFLLLPSAGTRIVIEVDGKQHYSDANGQASTRAYAAMVSADRELRLRGYEVYRFGGLELQGEGGAALVAHFFHDLFEKHGVLPGGKVESRP